MDDERDAEDAIQGLDRIEFGRKGRRLRVEWTKEERGVRRHGGSRRSSTNSRPSKTLFVINFDPYHTRTRDLERHFDPYGKVLNVRVRRNFAFIQYETEEDATRALDATNMSKLMDRIISVEYAIKDDDVRGNDYSPDRYRDRSPGRRGRDRGQSPSSYRRERASPDYGRDRSPSPYGRRERASPDYGQSPSSSLYRREKTNGCTRSPQRDRPSPDHAHEPPSPGERVSPDYRRSPSAQRERTSPDDSHRGRSPDLKPELRGSPDYDGAESPMRDGYCSHSPLE